jgi:hypothetical protein
VGITHRPRFRPSPIAVWADAVQAEHEAILRQLVEKHGKLHVLLEGLTGVEEDAFRLKTLWPLPPITPSRSPFVASRKRSYLHRIDCQWADYVLASPNSVYFASEEEAVRRGYRRCKTCCP